MSIVQYVARETPWVILKHFGLWFVKLPPPPKAHAPPALNQYDSGPAKYILDRLSQISMNDDHLHRDPEYPWDGYLQSQAKKENRGRKEPVCLGEPQKRLTSLAESLKALFHHIFLENSPNPPEKAAKQTQDVVIKYS